MENILEIISEQTGIPPEDILSRKRDGKTVKARHLLMYISGIFGHSNKDIAAFIPCSRSNVSIQRRKIAAQKEIYHSLQKEIEDISRVVAGVSLSL